MGLAGESGCGKTTLGYSLIHLTPPKKYVAGRVKLDGEELPIWDSDKMNPFRFKKVSIIPQYAMSAMNPTRKIGQMTSELLESRGANFKSICQLSGARLIKLSTMLNASSSCRGMARMW
jgi:peptide/nickel transport system ATP-binding protein